MNAELEHNLDICIFSYTGPVDPNHSGSIIYMANNALFREGMGYRLYDSSNDALWLDQ